MSYNLAVNYILNAENKAKAIIDLIGTRIWTNKNLESTVLISGTPRGGTTWLMEILETLPEYKSIFEPLHNGWFPESSKFTLPSDNIPLRPYHPTESVYPELEHYLGRVLKGDVVSLVPHYTLTLNDVYRRLFAKKILVKFVRANRLLPWITRNFNVKKIYLIIRHPCATISSQIQARTSGYNLPLHILFHHYTIPIIKVQLNTLTKSPDALDITDYTFRLKLFKQIILNEATRIHMIRENKWLIKKLQTIKTLEEVLAAIWSLDNYIPLSYLSEHPDAWYTVVYEKLITDFDDEIKRIFDYINEEAPEKVYEMFKRPSKTTHDKSYLGTTKQLLKWKKKLSERQIKNILKVVQWFGLDFYTEDPEPDYNALKNWKPPF